MDDNTGDLANEQIERDRAKVFGGRGGDGDITQNIGKDKRVSRFLDWLLPALALGVFWHFANKVGELSDALVTTNTQIAVMIKQNEMMQDGFKDHENRIRDLEGRKFRGIPGYGDTARETSRVH